MAKEPEEEPLVFFWLAFPDSILATDEYGSPHSPL